MFRKGSPQMRHSEGNKTEKRPSAAPRSKLRAKYDQLRPETIGSPATAVMAWPARIRSSLLLKTASSHPRGENSVRGQSSYTISIAATRVPRQRCVWARPYVSPASFWECPTNGHEPL
jgi:hypothetical protein